MRLSLLRFRLRTAMAAVAISAILMALLILVGMNREAQARNGCMNNLRQIGLAFANYASRHEAFPYGTVQNEELGPERRLGWLVILLSDLDQFAWLFDMARAWDDDANRITRGQGIGEPVHVVRRVDVFCCPAATEPAGDPMPSMTSYVGITGLGTDSATLSKGDPRNGVFGYNRQTRTAEIKDGLSTTLAVVETTVTGPWTAGGTHTLRGLDPDRKPYVGPGRQFGGNHSGGIMVLFADGSVRMLRDTIDPKTFEALSTIAGGERLPAGWDAE
jgi:prepilin-type processing-associated H-X9-DG protein